MVFSIAGLGSQLALNFIDSTKDRQLESLRNEPRNQREADAFRERIASISSPEEFVADFEVYSFVMKAFDLEDQIFGRGMIRKVLESDPSDETSLVNRLTNVNLGELHAALGFTTEDGAQSPDFSDTSWQEGIVDKFFETRFQIEHNEQNSTVGTVLELRSKVDEIDNWVDVLKDREIGTFFRTALGLPASMATLDIDQQERIFEQRYDIEKLKDPDEVNSLITRYVAISDALNPPQFATSTAVSLLGNVSGQFVSATIDIPPINYSAAALFR
ncbi:DUF1217 domain-containing protein [Cognatishimia activa]|uniref:DUF1217 domain-containing protein n=1 Tax=Cognatishimia activa TaxID=1715691 RepID=A0A0P1IXR9_9RHOB|nr:DUF1217 domain-containing protein [Cognatishimia activa]CUI98064.1 hypothetical protein TA5113_01959 [Cognatishimia activa]CUK25924.1 hypothetical protein TA5114_01728 [Cognatishimia activa]